MLRRLNKGATIFTIQLPRFRRGQKPAVLEKRFRETIHESVVTKRRSGNTRTEKDKWFKAHREGSGDACGSRKRNVRDSDRAQSEPNVFGGMQSTSTRERSRPSSICALFDWGDSMLCPA
jgi:hypothetical protein